MERTCKLSQWVQRRSQRNSNLYEVKECWNEFAKDRNCCFSMEKKVNWTPPRQYLIAQWHERLESCNLGECALDARGFPMKHRFFPYSLFPFGQN